jgi:hypothetical protein
MALSLAAVISRAQTGAPRTLAYLINEINTSFADNTTGAITPFVLRQVTLDIVASFQLLGNIQVLVTSSAGPTVNITAATPSYFFCLDPTSNLITVNLPASPAVGATYLIKDCTGQSAVHAITVQPASGNIDGNANLVIGVPYQSAAVTFTGAQWSIN